MDDILATFSELQREWQSIKNRSSGSSCPDPTRCSTTSQSSNEYEDLVRWGRTAARVLEICQKKNMYCRRESIELLMADLTTSIEQYLDVYRDCITDMRNVPRIQRPVDAKKEFEYLSEFPLLYYLAMYINRNTPDSLHFFDKSLNPTNLLLLLKSHLKSKPDMYSYIGKSLTEFHDKDPFKLILQVQESLKTRNRDTNLHFLQEGVAMCFTYLYITTSHRTVTSVIQELEENPVIDVAVPDLVPKYNRLDNLNIAIAYFEEQLGDRTNIEVVQESNSAYEDYLHGTVYKPDSSLNIANIDSERLAKVQVSNKNSDNYKFKEYIGGDVQYRGVIYETDEDMAKRLQFEEKKIELSKQTDDLGKCLDQIRKDDYFKSNCPDPKITLYLHVAIQSCNGFDPTTDQLGIYVYNRVGVHNKKLWKSNLEPNGMIILLEPNPKGYLRFTIYRLDRKKRERILGESEEIETRKLTNSYLNMCYLCKNGSQSSLILSLTPRTGPT